MATTGTYAAQTSVSADKSRAEIERTLTRYGATSFAYGWQGSQAMVGFVMAGRQIPVPPAATVPGRQGVHADADRSTAHRPPGAGGA
jgi:hypothetical protein